MKQLQRGRLVQSYMGQLQQTQQLPIYQVHKKEKLKEVLHVSFSIISNFHVEAFIFATTIINLQNLVFANNFQKREREYFPIIFICGEASDKACDHVQITCQNQETNLFW